MNSRTLIIRRAVLAVALPTAAAVLGMQLGCAPTPGARTMVSSESVPASEGLVRGTRGDNGNTRLTVAVKHLARPSKMAPGATIYVVWIQPRDGARQSVGTLVLDDNLEGTLETVTPHKHFLVSVTPEPNGQVAQPTHEPVLMAFVDVE